MQLNDVMVLLTIARTGSLAGAARQLDLAPMAVSRRLASLENELGVRLLHRTTRSVALTPEGEAFLPYAQSMLEAEEAARATLAPASAMASGVLRVTAPEVFGQAAIMPLIPQLLADHPALRVDLRLTDRIVDLVGEGLDVALRIAPLRDSALVARRMVANPRVLCASPRYLERHGTPRNVEDLASHRCLILQGLNQWTFNDGARAVQVDGAFASTSVGAIRAAAEQGLGIARLTYWDVRQLLAERKLVRIALQDGNPGEQDVWALLPTRRYTPLRVRVFLDTLAGALASA
jgi:DNA-binding transcriptional LysR family regulator